MNIKKHPIVIIGAGLTGLTLAYLLEQVRQPVIILEARERLGGRIFTDYKDGVAPLEMGATWLGKKHQFLNQLMSELKLDVFVQDLSDRAIYEPISTSPPQLVSLPPNDDPSYRISGGSFQLIEKLKEQLSHTKIHFQQVVQSIEEAADHLNIKTTTEEFNAIRVVSTLPPFLFTNTITTTPKLPSELLQVTRQTHTWMGESIKVALRYEQPFWRTKNSSGTIFSSVGPIPEMYDHSNVEDNSYALKGFFNSAYFSVTKTERLALVMGQLEKYYGTQAQNFISYEEVVWRNEAFTFTDYETHVLPHQNNGHTVFRKSFMNEKLWIAGAETATAHPGYMDGAVQSAHFIFDQLKITFLA